MRGRYLVVGEAPARDVSKRHLHVHLACRTVGRRPVGGTMSWLEGNHPRLFDFVMDARHANLLNEWPGHARRGSAFPMDEGRAAAERFEEVLDIVKPELVLLTGRRVAAAFGLHMHHRGQDYFEACTVHERRATVVPHPSGVNRWWNELINRERARDFLEELACRPGGWRDSMSPS